MYEMSKSKKKKIMQLGYGAEHKKKKGKKYKHPATEAFMSRKLGSSYSKSQEWKKPKSWDN